MRRRILLTYLSLLALVTAGLALPLGAAIAAQDTQTVFIDRQGDTARFASLAEPAIRTGRTVALQAELVRYEELYGISAAVVARDERVLISSRPGLELSAAEPQARVRVRAALAGERSSWDEPVWPWQDAPMVVAEPVGRGGEIIGAAVILAPTDALRAATLRDWIVLSTVALLGLLVAALAALPLAHWTMRPVADLDDVTHAITEGELGARMRVDAGPPELRRLAASFNTMAETITTLLRRQRSFVSYASHQLRNPLGALRLRVEELGSYLTPEGAEDHALTLDEVDRLSLICDGLLAVARADSAPVTPVTVNVDAVAENRIAAWSLVAARSDSRLSRTGVSDAAVRAPQGTLDQTLDVLIDNALKFASPGGAITVDVRTEGDLVHVHVIDDGPGLPEEQLQEATRPFWRDSDADGNGLGLAIVSTLLDHAGGALRLTSAQPHGIDARITLPAPGSPTRGRPESDDRPPSQTVAAGT